MSKVGGYSFTQLRNTKKNLRIELKWMTSLQLQLAEKNHMIIVSATNLKMSQNEKVTFLFKFIEN